ncbi:MAG TPA: N-acetylglucosamine-6-phosphate deacetylase [Acidimicrobiia bacterium]|nr:N-acetylglucosamine-6-phosphate deacetylase [Acidimicrobiia bacterium]
MTTIRNGRLAVDGELIKGDLHIAAGVIGEPANDDDVIDADGMIVSPGLIDIQINGGFGHDFTQDPTTIWEVGRRLPELGVTTFVPTIVTSPEAVTDLALEVVGKRRPDDYVGADVLGLHFEGPWISAEMHGAHNPDHIVNPNVEVARAWAKSGLVRIVTLAPERPGATEVAGILAAAGVVVSIGHTNATYQVAREMLSDSASLGTHLFNQMSPFTHREPGVVGALLLSDRPNIVIVDGLHIASGALQLAWRLLGPERTVLVTDAMAALGLGHGTYPLGDGPITVGDDGPRTADGRLAGSIVTLPGAVANLAATTGATIAESLLGATANPARVLGLADRGHLRVGGRGDVVLLDDDLRPLRTLMAGQGVGL